MADFNARRISDPVHNTIGLSDVEAAIISSSCTHARERIV